MSSSPSDCDTPQKQRRRRQSPFALASSAANSPSPGSSSTSSSPPLTHFFSRKRALNFTSATCKSRRTECPPPTLTADGQLFKQSPPKTKYGLVQTFIDAGQANPYHSTCKLCGMLFTPGHTGDDSVHRTFCAQYRSGPRIKFKPASASSLAPQPQLTTGESMYQCHRCHSHDPAKIRTKVQTAVTFVKATLRVNADRVETLANCAGKQAWMALLAVDSHSHLHGFAFISEPRTLKQLQSRAGNDGDCESGNECDNQHIPEIDWLWVLPVLSSEESKYAIADMMMASVGLKAADAVMLESNLDFSQGGK